MKVSNEKNIYNTNIVQEINDGKLVEGNFVVTGEGQIVPLAGVKKTLYQWLRSVPRNPGKLGKLLAELEAASMPNLNKDYLVEHGFAQLDEKSGLSERIRESFQRLKDNGFIR